MQKYKREFRSTRKIPPGGTEQPLRKEQNITYLSKKCTAAQGVRRKPVVQRSKTVRFFPSPSAQILAWRTKQLLN